MLLFFLALEDECDTSTELDGVDAGVQSTMTGCDVTVTVSPDAVNVSRTVMTFWQQVCTTDGYSVFNNKMAVL